MKNTNSSTKLIDEDVPTILIVDDDPDIIEFINQTMRIFNEHRFNIIFSMSAEGAISIMNIRPIDAVILDIKLPDITGINMGKNIKQSYPDMPIVIFTSYSGDNIREQVREIGASYWYKPDKMANPESLLHNLYNIVMGIVESIDVKDPIISKEEIENMKNRRKARIEKLTFPSFLIRGAIK